jgi:nucleoprotein TPR
MTIQESIVGDSFEGHPGMEAIPAPVTSTEPAPPPGELVLLTGRLVGTRQPLCVPITSVGRQPGCDVRLDVEGVDDLHCLIVCGMQGLMLRDLQSESGTFLNGERVQSRPLRDSDLLAVGPFQFRVQLNPAFLPSDLIRHAEGAPPATSPSEALLAQAAAVAAQQSALAEEEAKLLQRRQALEQQEQQLAGHLEEKRQRLLQLTEQTQTARAALQNDRASHQDEVELARRTLQETRTRLEESKRQAEAERVRFRALRRRLKQRWQRQLHTERANFRRREEALAEEARQLEQEARELQAAKDALAQTQLQWNGEFEVGRRQLQENRDHLRREQQLWQEGRRREQEDLERRGAELDRWETDLADLERRLAVERQQGQKLRQEREKEVEGLENRIRSLRRKLGDHEDSLNRLRQNVRELTGERKDEAPSPATECPAPSPSEEFQRQEPALAASAAELDDQRLQLLELWQTLAETEQSWRGERAVLLDELEALACRLQEREQDLRVRGDVLHTQEGVLERQRDDVAHVRQQLESWQLRFHTQQANWEAERDRLLAEVQAREQLAEQQLAGLIDLRERWLKRRRQEVQMIQAQRAQYEKLRQEAASLRKEWLSRTTSLEDRQRAVADLELALEQHRQETLARASDAVAAERALEKHRRRWLSDNAASLRALAQQRQAAQAELTHLDQRLRELKRQAQALHTEEADFSERRVEWEHEQVTVQAEQNALRQEVQRLQKQREVNERQLARLQDELDRVAGTLLNEGEAPPEEAPPLAA